jgi:hypothetical protein
MTTESNFTNKHHSPTPFEIASLAAQLSGGKDPKKHLWNAYNLYWEAVRGLDRRARDKIEAGELSVYAEEARKLAEGSLFFAPNADADQLRLYLQSNGINLKKGETVRRNLREYFIETGQRKKAALLKSSLAELPSELPWETKGGEHPFTRIKRTTIDEFIRHKKKRKSEGGKKSYRTKKKRAARKTTAKK